MELDTLKKQLTDLTEILIHRAKVDREQFEGRERQFENRVKRQDQTIFTLVIALLLCVWGVVALGLRQINQVTTINQTTTYECQNGFLSINGRCQETTTK